MTETPIQGTCLCGAVKVSMTPATPELTTCHCRMCQRWGGPGVVIDAVPGTVEATGPVKSYRSSDWAERAHCDICGSALWYRLTDPKTPLQVVSAGLFEDAAGFALVSEIFTDCKPGGYAFAGDHSRMTEAEFMAAMTEHMAAMAAETEDSSQ